LRHRDERAVACDHWRDHQQRQWQKPGACDKHWKCGMPNVIVAERMLGVIPSNVAECRGTLYPSFERDILPCIVV
jgi:hypothetical protein